MTTYSQQVLTLPRGQHLAVGLVVDVVHRCHARCVEQIAISSPFLEGNQHLFHEQTDTRCLLVRAAVQDPAHRVEELQRLDDYIWQYRTGRTLLQTSSRL